MNVDLPRETEEDMRCLTSTFTEFRAAKMVGIIQAMEVKVTYKSCVEHNKKLTEQDVCPVCNKAEYTDNCMSEILLLKTNGEIEILKIFLKQLKQMGDILGETVTFQTVDEFDVEGVDIEVNISKENTVTQVVSARRITY